MSAVVAIKADPEIRCPAWCYVSTAEHLKELPDADGFVIHYGSPDGRSMKDTIGEVSVAMATVTYVDGTSKDDYSPEHIGAERMHVFGHRGEEIEINFAEAAAVAAQITALLAQVEADR